MYEIEIPSNHGGERKGAGRNPVPDKKVQVYAMIKGSRFAKLGGRDKVRAIMEKAVETAYIELMSNETKA